MHSDKGEMFRHQTAGITLIYSHTFIPLILIANCIFKILLVMYTVISDIQLAVKLKPGPLLLRLCL